MRQTCEPAGSWVQLGNQNAQKQMKILNRSSFICVLLPFLAAQAFADVSGIFVPNAIRTNKTAIPSNAPIALKFFIPPAPVQTVPPASPATSTNFAGGDDNHTYYP